MKSIKDTPAFMNAWKILERSGILARIRPLQNKYRAMAPEQKMLTQTTVIVAVLAANLLLIFSPQIQNRIEVRNQIANLKSDLELGKKDIAEKDLISKALVESRAALAETRKRVLTEGEIPAFLDSLTQLANKNDVRIEALKPFTVQVTNAAKTLPANYAFTGYEINAQAGFHEWARFVALLESHKKYIGIEQMKVTHVEGPDSRRHNMNLKIILIKQKQA